MDYGKCFWTGNFAQGEPTSDHSSQAASPAQDAASQCAAQEPAAVHPCMPTVPGLLTANDSQHVEPSTHPCAVLHSRRSTRGRLAEKANLGTSGTLDGPSGCSGNSEEVKGPAHDPQKPNDPQITWYSAFLRERCNLRLHDRIRLLYDEGGEGALHVKGTKVWPNTEVFPNTGDHVAAKHFIAFGKVSRASHIVHAIFCPGVWEVSAVDTAHQLVQLHICNEPCDINKILHRSVNTIEVPVQRCVPQNSHWANTLGWAEYCADLHRADLHQSRTEAWKSFTPKHNPHTVWLDSLTDNSIINVQKTRGGGVGDDPGMFHVFTILGQCSKSDIFEVSWEVQVVEAAGGHLPAVREAASVLAACIQKYVPSAIVHVQHWLAQSTLRVTHDPATMGSVWPPALSEPSAPADPGNMRCVFV